MTDETGGLARRSAAKSLCGGELRRGKQVEKKFLTPWLAIDRFAMSRFASLMFSQLHKVRGANHDYGSNRYAVTAPGLATTNAGLPPSVVIVIPSIEAP